MVNSFPEEFVDITDEIDMKIKMYLHHKSQIDWLKVHDNFDKVESIKSFARTRGLQCDTGYVEGFTMCKQIHHIATKRFLP